MNMSDDVTGVTLQVVQKGADVAAHTAKELIDLIMRMLAEMNRQRERNNNKQPEVNSTDLTSIKPGRVGMDTLRSNAKTIGDTLSMSENALTKADMQFIAQKAKKYGIPVAFSNAKSKDNIFATVRTGDLPLFKQLCTELMKSKIAERPQELGNFHCEAWEIPFLTAQFNRNDLSAQFIQTTDGKNLCIFEKCDEKAIKMTRDSFVQQCTDVKNDLAFDRDENFITIKNQKPEKKSLLIKFRTRKRWQQKCRRHLIGMRSRRSSDPPDLVRKCCKQNRRKIFSQTVRKHNSSRWKPMLQSKARILSARSILAGA